MGLIHWKNMDVKLTEEKEAKTFQVAKWRGYCGQNYSTLNRSLQATGYLKHRIPGGIHRMVNSSSGK